MPLHPPTRTSVTAEVIGQLGEMIASGEWPVGTKIPPEPELVAATGVGRNTVREAVRALAHSGLLEARQGDGTYVRARTGLGAALEQYLRQGCSDAALQVLEVRRGLEREAARLAAARRDDDDLAAIDAAMDAQRRAIRSRDRAAFVTHDVAFHRAVAAAARNPVLADLLTHLGGALEDSVDAVVTAEWGGALIHTELAEAIRERRPADAADAAERLVEHSIALLEETS